MNYSQNVFILTLISSALMYRKNRCHNHEKIDLSDKTFILTVGPRQARELFAKLGNQYLSTEFIPSACTTTGGPYDGRVGTDYPTTNGGLLPLPTRYRASPYGAGYSICRSRCTVPGRSDRPG